MCLPCVEIQMIFGNNQNKSIKNVFPGGTDGGCLGEGRAYPATWEQGVDEGRDLLFIRLSPGGDHVPAFPSSCSLVLAQVPHLSFPAPTQSQQCVILVAL